MKRYKQALVIGRFQPLCKNHLDLFDQAKMMADTVLIGVGVPDYKRAKEVLSDKEYQEYKLKDLFSYERTKQFIDIAVGGNNKYIVPINDIFDKKRYAGHVTGCFADNSVVIDDCVLVGENANTYDCFSETKIDVVVAKYNVRYHATDVRREIMAEKKIDKLACELKENELERIAVNQKQLDGLK